MRASPSTVASCSPDGLTAGSCRGKSEGRHEPWHDRAGAVELAVQMPPLPVAVLLRRRLEGSPGGLAILELQGRCGGRDVGPIAFAALGLAALSGFVAGPLGSLLGVDRPAESLL